MNTPPSLSSLAAKKYEYHMVQMPPNISVAKKGYAGNEAAGYLQEVVSGMSREGWEFFRIDSIGVQVKPGCLAALFGSKVEERLYYVATFRR
jgi:hypothetical protein